MPKALKIFSYFLLILSLALGVIFYAASDKDGMTNVLLYYSYILFAVAILSAIILPLKNFASNPKGLKKALISLVVVVVVFGVSYLLSSDEPLNITGLEVQPSPSTLKITDTALYVTYILAAVSVFVIIYGGVTKMIKNR